MTREDIEKAFSDLVEFKLSPWRLETGQRRPTVLEIKERINALLPPPLDGAPASHIDMEQVPHPLASFPDGLKPGLYIIHWKSGGTSEAAIGMMSNGTRWIAPTNWISPGLVPSAGEWGEIERAEPIEVQHEGEVADDLRTIAYNVGLEVRQAVATSRADPVEHMPEVDAILERQFHLVRKKALADAALAADRAGKSVGGGDGRTYIPGTASDAARAIRALPGASEN